MANNSLDFKAFGVKDNLQKLVKRTGVLEIITGSYMLLLSFFVFFILISKYSPWKDSVFKIFGYSYSSSTNLGPFFDVVFAIIGSLYLVIATVALVSGLKTKSYSNNPVTLIKGKQQYITSGIAYIVFMVLMLLSIYCCIIYPFILFIFLIVIGLLAILTLTLYKFLAIHNIPDKVEILNIETLSDDKKEAIMLNSNNLDDVKKEMITKKEKFCAKCNAKMPSSAKKCPSCGELVRKNTNKSVN